MFPSNWVRLAKVASSRGPGEGPEVRFTPEEISRATLGRGLPEGFLLGAATAAHQVEGGNENDWARWERTSFPDGSPHIADKAVSGIACDSFARFEEDLALLESLGANAYRFSVEWSRLEPSEGSWNAEAAARYAGWLRALRAAGIRSMMTLYHFTLPTWVADAGGWQDPRTVERFAAFAGRVAERIGEPDLWCTINEPNVLAIQGYLRGIWPPGQQDPHATAEVLARQLEAHARATGLLRQKSRRPVGLAHHVRVFKPARRHPLDVLLARLSDDFVNQVVVEAYRTGRIRIAIPGKVDIDQAVPGLKGSFDYLGLNYYSRDHVQTDLRDPSLSRQFVPEGHPTTDLGWEVYPEGLYLLLKRYAPLGLPLYVTENGLADASGARRPEFLRAHLHAVERAVAEGADVRGYFHWSLLDNFEWAEGYEPRFGLYRVEYDRPDRRRSATSAVETFRELSRLIAKRENETPRAVPAAEK